MSGAGTMAGIWLTAGLPVLPWIIALGGVAYTGKKTYDWLRHRGQWGLKF